MQEVLMDLDAQRRPAPPPSSSRSFASSPPASLRGGLDPLAHPDDLPDSLPASFQVIQVRE